MKAEKMAILEKYKMTKEDMAKILEAPEIADFSKHIDLTCPMN